MLKEQRAAELDRNVDVHETLDMVPGPRRSTSRPVRTGVSDAAEVRDQPRRRTRPRFSISAFGRAHLDVLVDIAAVAISLANVVILLPITGQPLATAVSLLAPFLLLLRRRYPLLIAVLVIGALFIGFAQVAAMIALCTLARNRRLHWQVLVAWAGLWASRIVTQHPDGTSGISGHHHHHLLIGTVWGGILAAIPILIGLLLATQRDLRAKVRELATTKVEVNRLAIESARADERARLAREMHDVVSHQITLIAMQAGALQVAEDANHAEIAVTIRGLCTTTLNELRGLVGMLRSTSDGAHGAKSLDEVINLASQSGAELEIGADLAQERLPGQLANAAFRTVQEAITNARKHAPGADVQVRISADRDELAVTVTNAAAAATERRVDLPSGGHGLLGLRERARECGGTFSARPTDSGGFAVSATYPIGTVV